MNIIETKTLLTSKFLEFKETYYEIVLGGKVHRWNWVQRPSKTSAVVIAATVGDNLVLIKEYRVPIGGYIYELPAGLIDEGETPVEAGLREFHEETGLTILKVSEVSPLVFNSPGITDEAVYMMLAEATGSPSIDKHGASEDIEVMLYSRAAIQDLMADPEVKIGAKAWLVFRQFVKYGKL
jgi:ADP-ribose pyrophosphatase